MVGITHRKHVIAYADETGWEPFTEWLEGLRDHKSAERIRARLRRLQDGNYGDCEPVGEGVYELRMFFGSGYRVYFGEKNDCIVVLLCGGDKKSQKRDIKQAHVYWKEHMSHGEKI